MESSAAQATAMAAAAAELVRNAKRASAPTAAAAFSALVRRFERTALAVAYAACGDANQAADITQEAFLRAWRRLGELQDERKFAAWLCSIVRNLAADARRQCKGKARTDEFAQASGVPDPVSTLERLEQSEQIDWALQRLDEPSRTVVVLRYYENLSSADIAELVGATPAAVDMRLSRARRTLRELLDGSTCTAAESEKT